MEEIRPCPFCGDSGCEVAESEIAVLKGDPIKHAVFCNLCLAEGSPCATIGEAVEAWNHREQLGNIPTTKHCAKLRGQNKEPPRRKERR